MNTIARTRGGPIVRGNMSLADELRMIAELEHAGTLERRMSLGISANVTTDLLATFLKKHLLLNGVRPTIRQGSYDSHVENVKAFVHEGVEHLVLLNVFDNLLPLLESRIVAGMGVALLAAQLRRFREQLHLTLDAAHPFQSITVPLFHRLSRPTPLSAGDRVDEIIAEFNGALNEEAAKRKNVRLLRTRESIAAVGWERSFNARYYYRFKAPYAQPLCDEIARQIVVSVRAGGAYYYKALVLDCDNTLWGGIIGEDLLDGIKLSANEYPDNVYTYAQNVLVGLQRRGVLLCLCSKNNASDVDDVLANHPNAVLRDEHIVIKMVNWESKPDNLQRIASELNIGLDSIVFLDDSPFECEAMRERLPMVKVFQVPNEIYRYPEVLREIEQLFLAASSVETGDDKTAQYRQRALALEAQQKFPTQAEYLESLELRVTVCRNAERNAPRISELTQKSNQFNLTTRRYSETEVLTFMRGQDSAVYSLHVRDKFGDSGLTGVVIVRYLDDVLKIDSFLMSCRVIGRGIELAFWDGVCADGVTRGCRFIEAEFIQSKKNAQVKDFFDRLGVPLLRATDDYRHYRGELGVLRLASQPHVEVQYDI